ncbi:hypothetical protein SETIT_1G170800v2 [Setaria italica]|uniref:Uncharacterized protein n=1 Tax=Setaria italica TaxID=4555 RepID=A0A368PM10_SETIT|nr:hypothetical protein SETIT_1G170800v2 [Setaria italica]
MRVSLACVTAATPRLAARPRCRSLAACSCSSLLLCHASTSYTCWCFALGHIGLPVPISQISVPNSIPPLICFYCTIKLLLPCSWGFQLGVVY